MFFYDDLACDRNPNALLCWFADFCKPAIPDEPKTTVRSRVGAPLMGAPQPRILDRDRSLRSPKVDNPATDDDGGLAPEEEDGGLASEDGG